MLKINFKDVRPNVMLLMVILAAIVFLHPDAADTALGVLAGLSLKLLED